MQFYKYFTITFFVLLGFSLNAQNFTVDLWQKSIPNSIENEDYIENSEIENGRMRSVSQVSTPTLTAFIPTKNVSKTAVIICPGGGYTHLAMEKEGYKVAEWLSGLGIHAFVLKYRMPTSQTMKQTEIGPLQDIQRAVRMVRAKAKQFNIEIERVGVLGFSAGGHLASTIATHYDDKVYDQEFKESARPDFSILVYPVISMKKGITHEGSKNALLGENASAKLIVDFSNETQVNANTPPTFLVHATDDQAVPVENSINYYLQLKKFGVEAEMHIYKDGGHGFGLGRKGTHTQWPNALENWLLTYRFIQK
ncbi:alpha/beta hydrolase [Mesonia sp.]|uniref:alpha/beta hydrolase n=1 Tax=Mesonia sp. TaxID=1960830 RepID=UPI00176B6CAC|nr:alpha/beta hydrolase [Mesonia sp.]HIB38255.1 alpha/beta hydrolase [Mesonia sp.]HIO25990.1 alpha/beta hydrolase [Flavobacteriaceae bacterium]